MNFLEGEPSGAAYDDFVALFVPFKNGSRSYSEPAAYLYRNGNLSLCRQFGVGDCHTFYYQGNAI
ncbi:MAG: hypothetical protein ABJF23_03085 [Bryobacteraceae bacterium]